MENKDSPTNSPDSDKDIPVFKLFYDVTTPEGKAEREKLKAHGAKPCYFDYGPNNPLGKIYIENPQGQEESANPFVG